jgi:hypothetical protein
MIPHSFLPLAVLLYFSFWWVCHAVSTNTPMFGVFVKTHQLLCVKTPLANKHTHVVWSDPCLEYHFGMLRLIRCGLGEDVADLRFELTNM